MLDPMFDISKWLITSALVVTTAFKDDHWIKRFTAWVWMKVLEITIVITRPDRHHLENPNAFQRWLFFILGTFFCMLPALLVLVACSWTIGLFFAWDSILSMAQNPQGFWVLFGLLIIVGIVASALRQYFQSFFGGSELVFSLVAIYYGLLEAAAEHPDKTKVFLSVAGGLYVMVRGFDNIIKGWAEAGKIVDAIRRSPIKPT